MKSFSRIAAGLILAIALVVGVAAAETANKPNDKDRDGYTIFYLSLQNAGNILSDTIQVTGQEGGRTLVFKNHVLSCGTWMNGELVESTQGGKVFIKGNWKVTHNPFDIADLEVDLSRPAQAFGWAGTIVVDGRICIVANSKVTKIQDSGKP